MVQGQGKEGAWAQQKLDPESIVVAVVGGFKLDVHQIHGGGRRRDKEYLHDRVVQRDKVGEEVKVAGHEHRQEQDLRFARDASA